MHKWLLSFRARMAGLLAWVPRPVRRLLLWTVVAVPAALLVFTLALVPFTPGISDIRKAKSELPAQLMSADGKLLAEYRWANREWVELNQISPHVIDALIATEDHRFYKHFGLDWRRTASSVVLMACSICSRVTPSMVVGICVGSEVGWPPWMVTTPSSLTGALLLPVLSAVWANAETPTQSARGKALATASAMRLLRMGTPEFQAK